MKADAVEDDRLSTMSSRAAAETGPVNNISLWNTTASGFRGGLVASGHLSTDVAVIGAGVAGLSTALHLSELGIETIVLEAELPGSAATGASGGLLAPEFARGGIAKACKLYGRKHGERLARLVGRSAAFAFDVIRHHAIECELQANGFVSPGRSAGEVAALRADEREWKALGCAVEYLDARGTADAIGSTYYEGALYFENGGALNPQAYVNGLARVVDGAGVPVFTSSAVQMMTRREGGWRLRTQAARVDASRVVLAANGGNGSLHPSLSKTTLPLLVYEYATAPVTAERRRTSFGAELPYTDRQTYVFSVRFDGNHRVISAVPELIPRLGRKALVREAARRFRDVYSIELPPIDFMWPGTAYLNPTLLPAVYLPEDDLSVIAIQACNGRGLGVNTVIGSEVAELLASGNRESMAAPLLKPQSVPLHAIASATPKILMTLARTKDMRLGWRRAR